MKVKTQLLNFIIICILFNPLGFSQTDKGAFDQKRMDRDLRIMEGVIDKLLSGDSEHFLDKKTKGIYIQDYGIVFHSKQSSPLLGDQYAYRIFVGPRIVDEGKKHVKGEDLEDHNDLDIIIKSTDDEILPEQKSNDSKYEEVGELSEEELKQKEQKAIKEIKTYLLTFYKNYVPAIRQLKQSDHVAVLIDFDEWHTIQSGSTHLASWVSMKDVQDCRNHKLTESQLRKKIHFQVDQPQSDIATDINIMLEIFRRGLESQNRFDHMQKSGVYIDGFGALFFMEIPHLYFLGDADESIMVVGEDNFTKSITYTIKGGNKKDVSQVALKKSREKDVDQFKNDVFDLLASYGHTLRMPENEWVVLNFNLGESYFLWQSEEKEPSHMLIQIRKKDLDAYNATEESLEMLWKKAIIKKY